jgi:hypothetical protein
VKSGEAMSPVQALNRVADTMTSYCVTQAFVAACKLGVFEELSAGPTTAEDLASRTGIHPVACRRLLVALTKLEFIEREGDQYRNSQLGSYCTSSSPVNLAAFSGFAEPFYHMFEFLPDAMREYSPRYHQALGASKDDVFGALYEDPARLRQFAYFMNALSIPQGQHIAQHFDFTPYHCIMDVAGGPGGQSVQIGLRHHHLRGIVTDLAPVCQIATDYIQASGLAHRFSAIPSDLFEGPYPKGADIILLGHILHDWSDASCLRILHNSYEALPRGGLLLISESVLNHDHSGSRWALMKDLTMIIACESGSGERTEAEYRALLDATGFHFVETIRMDAPRDLLVARK